MKYAKGIMWLDDCRIPFVDTTDRGSIDRSDRKVDMGWKTDGYVNAVGKNTLPPEQAKGNDKGRFTPNLLVCDDMLNDGSVNGGGKMKKSGFRVGGKSDISVGLNGKKEAPDNYGDKGTNSRYYDLDKWFDMMVNNL